MYFILFIAIGIVVISIFNEITISYPNLKFYQDNDVIRVKRSGVKHVQKDDILLSCDSIEFFNSYNLDEYIERSPINSRHEYKFLSSKTGETYSVNLKYHRLTKNSVVFSLLLVSIVFLVMSYIIVAIGPEQINIFYLFMFFISIAITAATYRVYFYNRILYSIFIVSTAFIGGFYLSFLTTFPKMHKQVSLIVMFTAITLSLANSVFWLRAYFDFLGYKTFSNYVNLFEMAKINQVYLMLAIIVGIVIIAVKYRSASDFDKNRLKWFIIGQIVGFVPFVFLFSLSLLLFGHEWVNLSFVMPFLIFIPVSFVLGVLNIKLGSINFILARILIVFFYFIVGLVFLFIGEKFGQIAGSVIFKEIGMLVLFVLYITLVYFTYNIMINYILKFLFKEYYRKITLVKRYIGLLKDQNKTEGLSDEVLKHLMTIFDLEYIDIKEDINRCDDGYNIEFNNKKVVCFRKKKNEAINPDEMYIIKSFLNSIEKNRII